MMYAGSYKITNYKNINSIPNVLIKDITKNNSIIFVMSDLNLVRGEYPDELLIKQINKAIAKIYKQQSVFNNVEAVVLNGNIVNGCYNNQANIAFDSADYAYGFLRALINLKIPIYYIRGNNDCYISNQTVPIDTRGVLNFCNALKLGDILFLHGHNSLPFTINNPQDEFNPFNLDNVTEQKNEARRVSEGLKTKIVISNSNFSPTQDNNVISTGSFRKNGILAINVDLFKIADI